MQADVLNKLLENGALVTVLGFIVWILWKVVDRRSKANELKIDELQKRYEAEILGDREKLIILVKDNTVVMNEIKAQSKETQGIMVSCRDVMKCLIKTIQEVKPQFVGK